MELQLEKQKRMVYEKVLDRTAEETCSADFVVPDALADVGALLMRGLLFPVEAGLFGKERGH